MSASVSSQQTPLRSWHLSAAARGDLGRLITIDPVVPRHKTKESPERPLYQGQVGFRKRAQGMGSYSDARGQEYSGAWVCGVLVDGFVKQFFSPNSEETYVGRWTLYGANGIGALFLSPKRYYIGEWRNGKREGFGTLKASRMVFIGTFKDDEVVRGFIDMSITDTARYTGEWGRKGPHGQGIWKDSQDRFTMIGRWILGNFQSGFVENMPYSRNGVYTGEWGQNGPHGRGSWQLPQVASYQGSWEEGQFHGQGDLRLPFGNYQKGTFERHKFVSGSLRVTNPDDGTVYEGGWKQGHFEGPAVVTIPGYAPMVGTVYADGSWEPQSSCDVSVEECGPSPVPSENSDRSYTPKMTPSS